MAEKKAELEVDARARAEQEAKDRAAAERGPAVDTRTEGGYGVKNRVDPNAEHITVKSALPTAPDGGHKIALFERDPSHPNGEAFISGPEPVEVGKTPGVVAALRSGAIVEA